jgi:uncharacterized protein (TIGR02147 family)
MRVMSKNIYLYRSASRYLLDQVTLKQKSDRHFSIRRWTKEMGYPSHSLLSMVLQGKRALTLKQVPYLAKGLSLSTPEKLFFQGLIQLENAKTPEEKLWCETYLSDLRPSTLDRSEIREIDEYLAVADWIHPALLALSDTRESFKDASEASLKLGNSLTITQARVALERLIELKLIHKDSQGIYRSACARMTSKDDVINKGAREYHRQVSELASTKLEAQSVEEREFQSLAIAIPTQKLPLAKEMIRKFRSQFTDAMYSEHSDQIYQLNLHFFRLTERPLKSSYKTSKENEGADELKQTQPTGEIYVN